MGSSLEKMHGYCGFNSSTNLRLLLSYKLMTAVDLEFSCACGLQTQGMDVTNPFSSLLNRVLPGAIDLSFFYSQ
jgi:hypothetical protein